MISTEKLKNALEKIKNFWTALRLRFKSSKHRLELYLGIACIVIGIVVFGVGSLKVRDANRSRIINLRMENIGELSTQAAYFTNVQVISKSREVFGTVVPFTQSKYIYSYDGVIKAGIDFTQIAYEINSYKKTITVKMPQAHVTSVEVDEDSLEIYDESKNIFTPLKLADIQESRQQMEAEAVRNAIGNGVLDSAIENAKTIIQAFLQSDQELIDYEFIWIIDMTEE